MNPYCEVVCTSPSGKQREGILLEEKGELCIVALIPLWGKAAPDGFSPYSTTYHKDFVRTKKLSGDTTIDQNRVFSQFSL